MKKVIQIAIDQGVYYLKEIWENGSEVTRDIREAIDYSRCKDSILKSHLIHINFYYGASVVEIKNVSAVPSESEIEAQAVAMFPNNKELQSSFILGAYHTVYYGI